MYRENHNAVAVTIYSGENFGKEFNPRESEPIENLFSNQSEKHFESFSMKIGYKISPKFQTERIQYCVDRNRILNPNHSYLGSIRIDTNWKFN